MYYQFNLGVLLLVVNLFRISQAAADEGESESEGKGICGQTEKFEMVSTTDKSFIQEALSQTNTRREIQGWPPLKINDELCRFSQYWASMLAEENTIFHSGRKCGENLFTQNEGTSYTAERVIKAWYKEELKDTTSIVTTSSSPNADFNNTFWKEMRGMCISVARGKSNDSEGAIYVVAHYSDKDDKTSMTVNVNGTKDRHGSGDKDDRQTYGRSEARAVEDSDNKSGGVSNFQRIWISTCVSAIVSISSLLLGYNYSIYVMNM